MRPLSQNIYLMVILLITLRSLSQLFFKMGANETQTASLWDTAFHPIVLLGAFGFVLAFPISLNLHKLWPLKKMPIVNVSLVCSIVLAIIFLSEVITLYRAVGISLIVVGSILLGQTE